MEIWYTFTGTIDSNSINQLITWLSGQVYSGQNIEKLKLFISSNGGDMDSAIRAYTYLKSLPFRVETIGFTQIDSAANVIFLAGQRRTAVSGCRFFLHEGTFSGNQVAPLHIHEETLKVMQDLYKRYVDIFAKELKKSDEEMRVILKTGDILTTNDAKTKYGLVHDVVETIPLIKG